MKNRIMATATLVFISTFAFSQAQDSVYTEITPAGDTIIVMSKERGRELTKGLIQEDNLKKRVDLLEEQLVTADSITVTQARLIDSKDFIIKSQDDIIINQAANIADMQKVLKLERSKYKSDIRRRKNKGSLFGFVGGVVVGGYIIYKASQQ